MRWRFGRSQRRVGRDRGAGVALSRRGTFVSAAGGGDRTSNRVERDCCDREGFREFTAHTWLWTIVLQFSVMLMGWFGAWAVLGPVVAKQSLGGAASWGWIAPRGTRPHQSAIARPYRGRCSVRCAATGALIPLYSQLRALALCAAFASGIG
jgi:hypothetical protein